MATPCTIIGSANMELEQEFRMMTLELFQQLSLEECQKLAYVSSCMKEPIPPQCDYRLHVFSTLESRGKIGPLNLDFLENTLELIGRKELLNVIMKYKKKPIYKEVRSKKKSGRSKQKGKQMHLGASFNDMSTLHQYEDTFSFFLIQFAQMTLLMRSALESKDITHIRFAFSSAALEGDAVSRALRKKLSIRAGMAGINSDTSSRESSASDSTPSPHFSPESLLNPTALRATTESELSFEVPYQVSSPSSDNYMQFVYPPCSSASNLKCHSNCEADYTGGTGDSGVGDISSHIPSKEALQQIDPAVKRRDDDHRGSYQQGYTKLTFQEESRPQPNKYMSIKFDPKPESKDSSSQ